MTDKTPTPPAEQKVDKFIKVYKSRYSMGGIKVAIPFKSEAIAKAKRKKKQGA